MRPVQIQPKAAPGGKAGDRRLASARAFLLGAFLTIPVLGPLGAAQVPPPRLEPARSSDLVARRAAITRDEADRLVAAGAAQVPPTDPWPDGSSRFDPLADVVPAADPKRPAATGPTAAAHHVAAQAYFELALIASREARPPLAFVDECLREVLRRQPDHAEARRLLGFIPHGSGGWATPFAAQELARGKVKDPTFGWVPAEWVPHLARGELPAPQPANRWLPTADADALRRDWKAPWQIETEHFKIYANVPLAGVISFGRHLEDFRQLFGSIMADVIGPEHLPLAQRLKNPKLQPSRSNRPKHQVFYFATRDEYAQYMSPLMGSSARLSLGIYVPLKDSKTFGKWSYFFNDVNGQLDANSTLYHEVSHQLLFEMAGPNDYTRNISNYWVFEGLGTYFETVQPQPNGSIRVGGLVGPRIAQARKRFVDDHELVPLDEFVGMSRVAFNGREGDDAIYLHYAEAMALAVFLMQAKDEGYREPFLSYVRDAYKGQFRGGHGRTLEDRVDCSYANLQREFLAYLGRAATSHRPGSAAP